MVMKLRRNQSKTSKKFCKFSIGTPDCIKITTIRVKTTKYHVMGNHCLSLPRDYVEKGLGFEKTTYSFERKGIKFIVLDLTQISLFGWKETDPNYIEAQVTQWSSSLFPGMVESKPKSTKLRALERKNW
jgi:hypothetical protein